MLLCSIIIIIIGGGMIRWDWECMGSCVVSMGSSAVISGKYGVKRSDKW